MRPEGWDKKRCDYLHLNTADSSSVENICTYEAGADAMLEGLLNSAESYHPNSGILMDKIKEHHFPKGRLVFIPEA